MKTVDASWTVARKELADGLRNRWIWTVSLLLGTSVLAIAFFGAVPVGVAGARGGEAILASLMNLAVYMVPLLALVLGCGVIVDEKRRGTLDLILVYPLSPAAYFAGTFAGFALALCVAVAGGFGAGGGALAVWSDVDIGAYLLLTALAVLLGIAFLSLSFLISLLAKDRGRAVVSSVFVWICAVLIFDLVLVGLLVVSKGELPATLFGALLLINPADVFRILCFQWLHSAASPLGLSEVMPFMPSAALATTVLILWTAVPLALTYALFRRRVARDTLV